MAVMNFGKSGGSGRRTSGATYKTSGGTSLSSMLAAASASGIKGVSASNAPTVENINKSVGISMLALSPTSGVSKYAASGPSMDTNISQAFQSGALANMVTGGSKNVMQSSIDYSVVKATPTITGSGPSSLLSIAGVKTAGSSNGAGAKTSQESGGQGKTYTHTSGATATTGSGSDSSSSSGATASQGTSSTGTYTMSSSATPTVTSGGTSAGQVAQTAPGAGASKTFSLADSIAAGPTTTTTTEQALANVVVLPSSGSWTGAAAAHRANELEAELEQEEDDAEDDDDDGLNGLVTDFGFLPLLALPAAAVAAPAVGLAAAPVAVGGGLYALFNRKAKLKRRKKNRQHLVKKLQHAKSTGNKKAIARIHKKLAAKKAHVLKVAARRMKHGKTLSAAERRLIAYENAKHHAEQVHAHARRGMTYYPRPITADAIAARAAALEETAQSSDDEVANTVDTSEGALKATATNASAVAAAETDSGADTDTSTGPFGLSWTVVIIGSIVVLAGGGYALSRSKKGKEMIAKIKVATKQPARLEAPSKAA